MSFRHFALLLVAGLPLWTTAQQSDGIIDGVLSIKFTENAAHALDISTEGALVTTGLASVNQLNEQFDVTGMERIFRPAGRFEARHRAFGLHRWYTVHLPQGAALQSVREAYQDDPNVEIAEFKYEKTFVDGYEQGVEPTRVDVPSGPRASRVDITNDPLYGDQWHYHNTGQTGGTPGADISLPDAHDIQMGDSSVVVSIHDGGLDVDHEDLEANVWVNEDEIPGNSIDDDDNGFVDDVHGFNFADNQGTIIPDEHGTHVGGTVAATTNNETGVAGVAGGDGTPGSGVRIMSTQVFGNATGGFPESYTYAADMGAVISQNSWGYTNPGVVEQAVLDAIDYYIETAGAPDAAMEGGLVIFAAGNSDADGEWYPGYYEPTVAVASTNIDDEKSVWSNYGEWVDISAPGGTNYPPFGAEDVLSTILNDQYGYIAGTSMACPHASGVAALILSQNLGTTNTQVRTILEMATDDVYDVNPSYEGLLGTGRINAATAVGAEPDTTGPGVITDLAGIPDGDFATLTWTAPGDDSFGVQNYYVRYALDPIVDEDDWDNATPVPAAENLVPQDPGETEEITVTNLAFETTYYFSVRSDDGLNLSDISDPEEVTTLAPPVADVPTDPIEMTMLPDETTTVNYTISNTGPSTLSYSINFEETTEDLQGDAIPRPETSVDWEPPAREDEEVPPPSGEVQFMGEGGPDEFGYRWIDSNEPGGPAYEWIDISETGTELSLGLDDYAIVDLPFDFPYYENTYDWVAIQSKASLAFEDAFIGYGNQEIPDAEAPNSIIAGYWDDLNPSESTGGGAVYYDTLDDGRFVVTWDDVPFYLSDTDSVTVQIILEPGGTIITQYQEIVASGNNENSATIGIENPAGDDGLQVVYNAPYVENELAIRFSSLWVDGAPTGGQVAAGGDETLTLTFDSGGLADGTYTADMTVTTNEADGLTQEYTIPITLTIGTIGNEDNLAFEGTHRLSPVAPNPANGSVRTTLEVAEAQDVRIELFDVRGRKVATPFEGALAARTAQEITLDGSALAPGVYVLRISGETFAETRRVTVAR